MDEFEFLGGDPTALPLADRLDERRGDVVVWAAATVVTRYPQFARFRGTKGRRAWEQDFDFLLRRLHGAVVGGAAGLGASTEWLTNTLVSRGIVAPALAAALGILQEALLRFLGTNSGGSLARRLQISLQCAANQHTRRWLGVTGDR
ncbi:MAG: hypothetical protein KC502_09665 [Myxococcales bacterium]|nr:hypothetical protein [Myxococcales bacterium]